MNVDFQSQKMPQKCKKFIVLKANCLKHNLLWFLCSSRGHNGSQVTVVWFIRFCYTTCLVVDGQWGQQQEGPWVELLSLPCSYLSVQPWWTRSSSEFGQALLSSGCYSEQKSNIVNCVNNHPANYI